MIKPIRTRVLVGICLLAMMTLNSCGLQPNPSWPPSPPPQNNSQGLNRVTHPWSTYY